MMSPIGKVQTARSERGFTLVEMAVTVAILAVAAGLVFPAIGHVSKADLRKFSGMLAGTMRATYDNAVLNGQIHRLVFDFKAGSIVVEATPEQLTFEAGSNALVNAVAEAKSSPALASSGALAKQASPLDILLSGSGTATEGGAPADMFADSDATAAAGAGDGFQSIGEGVQLEKGVRLLDFWSEGMPQPESEGRAYLYFFPHGYTQNAVLHLQDESGRVFAVRVQPLTGKTEIFNHYVEANR